MKSLTESIGKLLLKTLRFLCGGENGHINRSAFWTMLGTLFGITLIFFGYLQIVGLKNTTDASFIQSKNQTFFNAYTRDISMLIEYNLLEFDDNGNGANKDVPTGFPIFKVNRNFKHINRLLSDTSRRFYSVYEIEDYVLGPLDEMALYEKNGIVTFKDTYDEFGWNLALIGKSKPFKSYFNWLDTKYNHDYTATDIALRELIDRVCKVRDTRHGMYQIK